MINFLKIFLHYAVFAQYGIDTEIELTIAPENTGADYATNVAMQLAKLVHKAPIVIAEELKAQFEAIIRGDNFELLESSMTVNNCDLNEKALKDNIDRYASNVLLSVAKPGFLNFQISEEYLRGEIKRILDQDVIETEQSYANKVVVCEFSDPNPFKVLHVGHLYTSIVGDSIARLLECAGAKVIRANFGGDVGLHVGKTLWALQSPKEKFNLEDLTIERIAEAYIEGTRAYEENEIAHQEITHLNAEVYNIALNDRHDSELAKLYWHGRELSYQYFKDFYARIGVHFDKYYPESTVAERGLEEVRIGLDRGVYDESDGAVVYRGEKLGLHTRVFINRAGLPTYETKDVGLIFTKWDDWHFDESVVITGNDIVDYMKVVLASVSELEPKLSERTRHLTHGQVKLAGNEKMSSRKGNFLKAVDVINLVEAELAKFSGKVDPQIMLAAIKYAFLKYRIGGDIIFDPGESVAMTGNSGVYLLYAVVRAKKILQKSSDGANAGGLHDQSSRLTSQNTDGDVGYVPIVAQEAENVNAYTRTLMISCTL